MLIFFLVFSLIYLSQIIISAQEIELNQLLFKSELYYKNDTLFTGHFVKKLRDCHKVFIFQEGEYVNGKKDLVWTRYKLDGKTIEYKRFYDEGVLIKNIVYGKNDKGEVIEYENVKAK